MVVSLVQHTLSELFRLTLYTFIGTFDTNVNVATTHAKTKLVLYCKNGDCFIRIFCKVVVVLLVLLRLLQCFV